MDRMCNLSQRILEEGLEKCRLEGRELDKIECIRNLMQSTGWSQTEAFKALKVAKTEWSRYSKLLEEKSLPSQSSEALTSTK